MPNAGAACAAITAVLVGGYQPLWRAREPYPLEVGLYGQAARGVEHILKERIAVRLIMNRDGLDLDLVPVGVQLVSKYQRQCGGSALTHLRRGILNRDGVVGADRHPDIRGEIRALTAGEPLSLIGAASGDQPCRTDDERQSPDTL